MHLDASSFSNALEDIEKHVAVFGLHSEISQGGIGANFVPILCPKGTKENSPVIQRLLQNSRIDQNRATMARLAPLELPAHVGCGERSEPHRSRKASTDAVPAGHRILRLAIRNLRSALQSETTTICEQSWHDSVAPNFEFCDSLFIAGNLCISRPSGTRKSLCFSLTGDESPAYFQLFLRNKRPKHSKLAPISQGGTCFRKIMPVQKRLFLKRDNYPIKLCESVRKRVRRSSVIR